MCLERKKIMLHVAPTHTKRNLDFMFPNGTFKVNVKLRN
jgi:hypothetical protein